MAGHYSEAFKQKIVQRILLPGGPDQRTVAEELGVSQSTVSRWVRGFGTVAVVPKKPPRNEPVDEPPRRPEDWSEKERLRVVLEAGALTGEELGAFLRREGLHEETLGQWRQEALAALAAGGKAQRRNTAEIKRVQKLERELARSKKSLAAANALLDLQKKVQAIWGDADDDTKDENEK